MRKQKFKIKGEEFEFELEIDKKGFCLWTTKVRGKNQRWIIDASTICDDGTFDVGRENDGYGFTVEHDDYEFGSTHFRSTHFNLVRHNETQKIPLQVEQE